VHKISSIINNRYTFCISVTLLPYICFGCGPAILRGTLVGSLHWHWFIWYYHTSQWFCSFCSLSNAVCVRLASNAFSTGLLFKRRLSCGIAIDPSPKCCRKPGTLFLSTAEQGLEIMCVGSFSLWVQQL
jgi:hypothetical protein